MKRILITLAIILLANFSYCQISRAFNQNENTKYRNDIASSVNGQLYYFSTKSSSLNSLVITSTEINEFGETSNYVDYEFPGEFDGYEYRISGQAMNGQGELIFCIQALQSSTTSTLNYIRFNPATGQVSEKFTIPHLFLSGFTQSQQSGDDIVTYISWTDGVFFRVSMYLDGFLGYDLEPVMGANVNYSGGGSSGMKAIDLLVLNNEEFVAVNSLIYKRNNSGVFVSASTSPVFPIQNGVNLCSNNLNQVTVFSGNKFAHFSNDLNVLTSGQILGLSPSSGRISTVYYINGKYIYYLPILSSSSGINDKVIINDSFEVDTIYKNSLYSEYVTSSILSVGNKKYIAGLGRLNSKSHSMLIESNGILPDTPLIEYDQILKHQNMEVHTNHLGVHFSDQMSVAGFKILDDGLYKGLVFSGSNSIIGKALNGDTIGYSLLYQTDSMSVGPFVSQSNRTRKFWDKYNRGYYVTSEMINIHVLNYTSPSYIMPFGIREWPGNGNVSNGEPLQLLPFNDLNNNGIYEPQSGEFPMIYGDQCVAKIYHQNDEMNSAGIECHEYIYAFNCDTSEVLNNTIFMNQHFFLRESSLLNAYVGTFLDPDIGGYSDDFGGTHVQLGMAYAYNGDQFDENSGGALGFLDNLPALGMQTLLGTKLQNDGQDNAIGINQGQSVNGFGFQDGIVDNEYYTMESSYVFGSNLMGNPQVNGLDTRYAYFGSSDPQFYATGGIDHGNNWSEETAGNNQGDRRLFTETGPIDIHPSMVDTVKLVTAYIVAYDSIDANFDELLFNYGAQLKSQFAENNAGCNETFGFYELPMDLNVTEEKLIVFIYPNPTTEKLNITVKDNSMNSIRIMSMEGKEMIYTKSISSSAELDVTNLFSGIYILLIETDRGVITKKFTKM